MVANVLLNLLLDTKNGFKLTSVAFRLYVRHCLVSSLKVTDNVLVLTLQCMRSKCIFLIFDFFYMYLS